MRVRGTVLVALLVATPLLASVKGSFTANGTKVALTNGHAITKANPFDKTKSDVFLVFTDKELPEGALFDDFKMMSLADDAVSGVTVQIDEDKRADSGSVFSPAFKKMNQFSSTGNQKIEISTWTKDRIAGTLSIPADDFFDQTYQYDVAFDLPIEGKPAAAAPKPLAGKALPADGGEPGKAFEVYRKALASGDMATLRKIVTPEMASQMDSKDFKEMFPLIQQMEPKKVKITGGAVDGDEATLLVTSLDEENSHATVTMHKNGGKWQLVKESWKSGGED